MQSLKNSLVIFTKQKLYSTEGFLLCKSSVNLSIYKNSIENEVFYFKLKEKDEIIYVGKFIMGYCKRVISYYKKKYLFFGVLHRFRKLNKDKPSILEFYEDENSKRKLVKYYYFGRLKRTRDKPTVISYYPSGNRKVEKYFTGEGNIAREGKPSVISYHTNGKCKTQTFYKGNLIHRPELPAYFEFREDGTLEIEKYYKEGLLSRGILDFKPVEIHYFENGNVKSTFKREASTPRTHSEEIERLKRIEKPKNSTGRDFWVYKEFKPRLELL